MKRAMILLAIVIGAGSAEAARIGPIEGDIIRYTGDNFRWFTRPANAFEGRSFRMTSPTRGEFAGCRIDRFKTENLTTTFHLAGHGTVTTFFKCRDGSEKADVQFFNEPILISQPYDPNYPGQKFFFGSKGAELRLRDATIPEPLSAGLIVVGLVGLGIWRRKVTP